MIAADIDGDVEARFGDGTVLPQRAAVSARGYAALPPATPPEEWSAVDDGVAVDLDDPDTPARIAAVVRALGVDAGVVVRHEWWVTRTRFDRIVSVVGFDRASVLVVDGDGAVLWRDSVVTQQGARATWGGLAPGFGARPWTDEVRQLARTTARTAWRELRARERAASRAAATTPPSSPPARPAAPSPADVPPTPLAPP
jgi:hypothetical protein